MRFSAVFGAKNGARAKIRRRGGGREGRKETLAAKHCNFENRPFGLSCLTDFTLSSSIQVAFVIHMFARFEILDHCIFLSNKNHTRLP